VPHKNIQRKIAPKLRNCLPIEAGIYFPKSGNHCPTTTYI